MLSIADWIIVFVPVILGLLGAYVSFRPPGLRAHKYWLAGFVLLGTFSAGATLWQLKTTRQDDAKERKRLQDKIDKLHSDLAVVRTQALPQLQQGIESIGAAQKAATQHRPRPDLHLEFRHPRSLTVSILNRSSAIARDGLYYVGLWDLDAPQDLRGPPIQLPVRKIGFVRPQEWVGPNEFLANQSLAKRVVVGHRLFGFAAVTCPECIRSRRYWVYLEVGRSGWYAESKVNTLPIEAVAAHTDEMLLKLAPLRSRVPIPDR